MAKYLKNKVYITLPGTGRNVVRIPVKAKALKRKLSCFRTRDDVIHGVQGECGTCANSIAAVRSGLSELAQFTDSRVFLIDKFDKHGTPTECSVGGHDQGKFQKQFDTNKKGLLKSENCEGVINIRPLGNRHVNKAANKPHGPRISSRTSTQVKRERGAAARALRAGIVKS